MQLLTHFNFPLIFLLVSCQFVINLSLINPPAKPSPDGITMCPWRPALLVVLVSAFHDGRLRGSGSALAAAEGGAAVPKLRSCRWLGEPWETWESTDMDFCLRITINWGNVTIIN